MFWRSFFPAAVGLSSSTSTVVAAQWTQTTSLPDGYAGHSLTYASGFLYQAGGGSGINGETDGANVFYAQVQSDGTVGTWHTATPLPEAVFDHAGVAANGFAYILGGYHYFPSTNGIVFSDVVYCARINLDGTLGSWQTANPLPKAVIFLSAAVWDNTIYVIGGYDGTNLLNVVYSSQIQTNGSLTAWLAQSPVPDAVYTHAEVANGLLYVLGGSVNGGNDLQNRVYYSKINANGTLAGWNQTTPLPQALSNFGAVAARG